MTPKITTNDTIWLSVLDLTFLSALADELEAAMLDNLLSAPFFVTDSFTN